MDLLSVKIIAMVLMGALALFFGLLPLKVKSMILKGEENSRKRRRRERFISGLLCFGSGVLLATVFIHMIPETREGFEKAKRLGLLGSDHNTENNFYSTEKSNLTFLESHGGHHHTLLNLPNAETFRNAHRDHNHSHKHADHDSRASHHNEHESEHRHNAHTSEHTEYSDADGTPFNKNVETENIDEFRKTYPEQKGPDVHAHDEHSAHETAGADRHHEVHTDERMKASKTTHVSKESEGLQGFPGPEHSAFSHVSSEKDFFMRESNTLPSESLSRQDENMVTTNELLTPDKERELETSSHFRSHDHPHPHDHAHDDLYDSANTHASLEPTVLHARNSIDRAAISELNSKAPKPVINEVDKVLEHPKENAILNRVNDSHNNGEGPHFSPLLHKEEGAVRNHDHDHDHDHGGDSHDYPLAELFICVGFFFIYIIEEFVHKVLFKHSSKAKEKKNLLNKDGGEDLEEGCSHAHTDHLSHISHISHFHSHASSGEEEEYLPSQEKTASTNRHASTQSTAVGSNHETMSPRSEWGVQGIDNPVFAGDIDATTWNPKVYNSLVTNNKVSPMPSNEFKTNYSTSSATTSPQAPPDDAAKKKSSSKGASDRIFNNLRSLLIVIALSFHGVFEGMAVGLQEVISDVWYLFLAICAHKFVIIFCIGLELLEAKTPLVLMILYVVVLALIGPFGIGIGVLVTENSSFGGQEHTLIIAILQGMAGGTLLYVAFLEILERERSKRGGRVIKLFCLTLGFALMASLEAIGGHSHDPVKEESQLSLTSRS